MEYLHRMVFLTLLDMGKIFVVYTCCTKGNDTLFMYYESIMSTTLTTLILSNTYVIDIHFSTCAMLMCLAIEDHLNYLKQIVGPREAHDWHVM